MKRTGFYAGSFDPVTRGHLAVICEALCSFDTVIVGIGCNPLKKTLFTLQERKELIRLALDDLKQSYLYRKLNGIRFSSAEKLAIGRLMEDDSCLQIVSYDDLTVDAALRFGATTLIRGERPSGDSESEMRLAMMNRELLAVRHRCLDMEMVPAPKIKLAYVSSSAAKGLCAAGEYVAAMRYVTPSVHQALAAHYLKKRYASVWGGRNPEVWDMLQSAYSNQRSYHTLSHVAYCLNYANIFCNILDSDEAEAVLDVRNSLEQALFWHDYCCGQSDAEELSADEWAKSDNECGMINTECVRELIMATKHDGEWHDCNEACQVIHDVDLAILGDIDNYGTYAMLVCQEYASCSPKEYAKGRIAVLQRFLDGNYLYYTEFFRDMFEENAEMNIRRELAYWQNFL